MAYQVRIALDVRQDLRDIPAHYRARILDAIENQLPEQPTIVTKNRKPLHSLVPPWDANPPVWELRVGDYRVFYDVSEE